MEDKFAFDYYSKLDAFNWTNYHFYRLIGVFESKIIQRKTLIPLLTITFAIMSCTNDPTGISQLSVLDENNKTQFTLTKAGNQFKVSNAEVDSYLRSDLKLPKNYALDYVEMAFNEELGRGAVVVQYLDVDLNQVPIGVMFSKKEVDGEEVLSLGIDGGSKYYQCQAETGSYCSACCKMEINSNSSKITCDCDPPNSTSSCWWSPNGCEIVEIDQKGHQGNNN